MARRSSAAATVNVPSPGAGPAARVLRTLGNVFNWTMAVCVLIGGVWAAVQIEQFVITDKRFELQGPPEPGTRSEYFQIEGIVHASEQSVVDVFSRDFGRSIYLCPISERRLRLLGIDWIREASVSRIWPNRIFVKVVERAPVAFIQVPTADRSMAYGLVDADGVILDPQRAAKLTLPVLAGVSTKNEARRKDQIRRFLRLQKDLGPLMEGISEIDVSDLYNLRVTVTWNGRALTLMLGDRDFDPRYRTFADHEQEVMSVVPNARLLDLRLRGRFTAVVTEEPETAAHPKRLPPPNREMHR